VLKKFKSNSITITVHWQCQRQTKKTDRWTTYDSITALCRASCGKKNSAKVCVTVHRTDNVDHTVHTSVSQSTWSQFIELVTTQTVNDKLHLPNKLEINIFIHSTPSDVKRGQTTETEAEANTTKSRPKPRPTSRGEDQMILQESPAIADKPARCCRDRASCGLSNCEARLVTLSVVNISLLYTITNVFLCH